MHGLLDESRTEAIGQQYSDDEQALNKALERQGEWRKFVVGAASTKRAIVNPVSSDTCGLPSSNMSLGTGGVRHGQESAQRALGEDSRVGG